MLFSFEIKLPTGDGECGAEEADFSIPIMAEDGGDTDRFRPETEADIKGLDVTANGSLLLGRGHRGGGAFAPAFVGGAVMPPGPPTVDEARITAAAALGAERLLSGTRGVLKIAVIKKKISKINYFFNSKKEPSAGVNFGEEHQLGRSHFS